VAEGVGLRRWYSVNADTRLMFPIVPPVRKRSVSRELPDTVTIVRHKEAMMAMRSWRVCIAVFACGFLVACGRATAPESPSPLSTLPALAAGSFGVLAQTAPAVNAESQFARCLARSTDAACFSVAMATSRLVFADHLIVGEGVSSRAVGAAADTLPDPPTTLTFSVTRSGGSSRVFLSWRAPTTGPTPTNYRIEAGSATGLSDLAAFNTADSSTFFSTTVSGSGTFYVRVRAVAAGGMSQPSNEVLITLFDPALPVAPVLFTPQVNGSTVTLSWFLSSASAAPTSYIIQASSTAGGPPDLANFATGNTLTTITAFGVLTGTYFVRVLAANNAGVGPASNEVSLIVLGGSTCTAAPNAPSNLVSIVNGSTVTLGWSPSTSGAPTSYIVEAGSAAGLADLATADTGSTSGSATFTGVGRGTYYVRVRGKNACGVGSASNEIVVAVK
jgi:hypothetical protein